MIGPLSPLDPFAGGIGGSAPPLTPVSVSAQSFTAVLSQAAANNLAALGRAEEIATEALQGRADAREVVDVVLSAERSLQAAIAIRDKIVTSYLEISRMAI
jgi:flagellar hook-basal body complex protein FliE